MIEKKKVQTKQKKSSKESTVIEDKTSTLSMGARLNKKTSQTEEEKKAY